MHLLNLGLLALTPYSLAMPLVGARTSTCSSESRIAAVKAEIATIRSHTEADAAKIPLTPTASRTFFVTYG